MINMTLSGLEMSLTRFLIFVHLPSATISNLEELQQTSPLSSTTPNNKPHPAKF